MVGIKEKLIVSKKRVSDFGEVYTPKHIVHDMIDLVRPTCSLCESKILEPSVGKGTFLEEILKLKLQTALNKKNIKENVFISVASLYGVDILKDNVEYTKQLLLDTVKQFYNLNKQEETIIEDILDKNIIWGNTLEMKNHDGSDLFFHDWIIEQNEIKTKKNYLKDMINHDKTQL